MPNSKRCPPCPEPDNCFCDQTVRFQEEIEGRPQTPEAYIEGRWPPGTPGRSAVLSFWRWRKRME